MADPKSALEKANLLAKAMDKLKSATEAVVAPFGEAAAAGEQHQVLKVLPSPPYRLII